MNSKRIVFLLLAVIVAAATAFLARAWLQSERAAIADLRSAPVPFKRVRTLATVGSEDEVEEVLATMQRTGAHLARVVDPGGGVRGVVFLEDVLEELVGEVTDPGER